MNVGPTADGRIIPAFRGASIADRTVAVCER